MTEISWWMGLPKEFEMDLESISDKENKRCIDTDFKKLTLK